MPNSSKTPSINFHLEYLAPDSSAPLEALEEYTKEFPVRDYSPQEELEARPFLSVAQVRSTVSRYRSDEHPPVSRMSREAASAYIVLERVAS